MTMKTILVPTDFSQPANNALTYALAIARKSGARVILMHAYHMPASNTTVFRDVTSILKQDAERDLADVARQLMADPQNAVVKLETAAVRGDLVNGLKKIADETRADLIVMGTKGTSGLSEILVGTNTASVIEDISCPVMAIPEQATYREIKQILYATDYQVADDTSISQLAEFASLFGASILLLHVAGNTSHPNRQDQLISEYTEKIKRKVAYPQLSFRLEESPDILNGLNNTIQSMNIDLVAMTTRKRNVYENFFKGSITKKMAYHTHIPLLAFHA
jgi:nucleotide-binding universal stress UspA family protein